MASTESSGMVISGSRLAAAATPLFLPPPTRIFEISEADTLHDLDRYSMGSIGVCGGGIAATASSSSSSTTSMPKAPATSLAFQPFSIAISRTSCCSCAPSCLQLLTAD